MNNKDNKKHPSAQALSDDDLESVGGGWSKKEFDGIGTLYHFSDEEMEKLRKNYFFKFHPYKYYGNGYYRLELNPEDKDIERFLGIMDK